MRTTLLLTVALCGCSKAGGTMEETPPDAQVVPSVVAVDAETPPDAVPLIVVSPDARQPTVAVPDARPTLAPDARPATAAPPDAQPASCLKPPCTIPACASSQVFPGGPCLEDVPVNGILMPKTTAAGECVHDCADVLTGNAIVEDRQTPPVICSSTPTPAAHFLSWNGLPYSGPIVCVPTLSDCGYCW